MDVFALAALLIATGTAAGFLAGLLGIGGGIVIVPALYHVFGVLAVPAEIQMHMAVGTSLATIVATGFRSARAHHRRGSVETTLLYRWLTPLVIGAIGGSILADILETAVLTAVFALVALVIAAQMMLLGSAMSLREELPGEPIRGLIAAAIGTLATLMGIGGGMLTVPALRVCGYQTRNAVATAAAVGFVISVPATFGFVIAGWNVPGRPPLSLGYVNLIGFVTIAPATMLLAPIGARVAHLIPQHVLRRVFGLFLLVAAGRLLYGSLAG